MGVAGPVTPSQRKTESRSTCRRRPDTAVSDLVGAHDVVLEQFDPDLARRLGIECETLAEHRNRIVHCWPAGRGQTGPDRAGHELDYAGVSGVLDPTGPHTDRSGVHPGTRARGTHRRGGVDRGFDAATVAEPRAVSFTDHRVRHTCSYCSTDAARCSPAPRPLLALSSVRATVPRRSPSGAGTLFGRWRRTRSS